MTGKVADNPDSVYSKTGGINGVIMIKEIDSVYKSVYEELETLKVNNLSSHDFLSLSDSLF